jgi:hypothetical protein
MKIRKGFWTILFALWLGSAALASAIESADRASAEIDSRSAKIDQAIASAN